MQDIYIDDIGSGFPLVLVHGYLGSSEMWNLQKEFLSKNFRVISPALPGFGESHKVKSLNSISDTAKLILKCLDEKKVNEFHLMGHSMGGMIVQEMVKISKNRVKKLICFATGSIGDIPGRFETIKATRERLKKDGLTR
jgi:Predicted hydrolases or acyltransferases (alpha/beta hydrolase superfamily)